MSNWGERMASYVTACGPRPNHPGIPYHRRLEKVKFGVPLDQVCKRDIPGPLLVMLLKLNKEGPFKKDVFRAPGHQGNMRKLIHFLQQGRLVNIHSFSVNTIASVLKKFLRKIPGGIFGPENEAELFQIIKLDNETEKLDRVQRLFLSLPLYSQHLLVLLFGTFRVIHTNSQSANTGMTAEALGVSVAPSFFHTCVAAGKTARMEDVERFKLATKVTTFFIEHFGLRNLFGRDNYEYYARLTGRILKVEDEWIFFTYPAVMLGSRDDMDPSLNPRGEAAGGLTEKTSSLEMIPENCPLDNRLSISLDDKNVSSPSSCGSPLDLRGAACGSPLDLRAQTLGRPVSKKESKIARGGELKTFTCLPQWDCERRHSTACFGTPSTARGRKESYVVHQRQTERMKHRSEWFLSDPTGLVTVKCRPDRPTSVPTAKGNVTGDRCDIVATTAHSTTAPSLLKGHLESSLPPPNGGSSVVRLRRRLSDKDKERRLVRRSSSKRKDKENGSSPSTPRPVLKRAGSADGGGPRHPHLCRTGSQDTPHTPPPSHRDLTATASSTSTKSLPRI